MEEIKKFQQIIEIQCYSIQTKKIKITKELLEKLYLIDKKSIRKIAKIIGCYPSKIGYYINKYKIPTRTKSEAYQHREYKQISWCKGLTKEVDNRLKLISEKRIKFCEENKRKKIEYIQKTYQKPIKEIISNLYWNNKYSQQKIAKMLNIPRIWIITLMKEYDIKKRLNYLHIFNHKGKNHPLYGTKWEDVCGIEGAKLRKNKMAEISRNSIIKRLKNQKMPYSNTKIERKIARCLKTKNIEFESQFSIDNKFVCDFVIPQSKIIIECDGDYWHGNPSIYNQSNLGKIQLKNMQRDIIKDKYVKSKGWSILHFFETDINKNIDKCLNQIEQTIKVVV